ncbi:hypothetical protein CVS27_11690 [Arthrobacter glacialis]|uniref:Methyltransferase domain-containing protein n=1 Tax=Arthrobacter glacialis TaxID=1664 RepID=A0A2S3ZVR3_ARTGL|nr:hypothetical protein CVS27_11690 [Arthrobacter glacialis]
MNQFHSATTASSHSAVLHDDVRPTWSAEVVSWLLGSPLSGQRLAVLDLGAGTGLGTRAIATLGHTVTAVDTSADMLSVLRKSCEEPPPESLIASRLLADRQNASPWAIRASTPLFASKPGTGSSPNRQQMNAIVCSSRTA